MQDIRLVVTDLDDTIWDWLTMWYNSFEPYLSRISDETGISKEVLIKNFKSLHQHYGTTEMSFAYKELGIIDKEYYHAFDQGGTQVRSIIHEYYSNKKNSLRLYDGVVETLRQIKSRGTKVVAFTESYVFFTKYRIKHLNLDGIIDTIYSPKGSNLPLSVYRHYSEDFWDPQVTEIRTLSNDIRKPSAEILNQIVEDYNVDKAQVIYIGDKLDRDVFMAQQSGITSVHAKYGHVIDDDKYALLKRVTHWTDEDVQREIEFKENNKNIPPADFILNDFSELLDLFNYVKY